MTVLCIDSNLHLKLNKSGEQSPILRTSVTILDYGLIMKLLFLAPVLQVQGICPT